MPSVGIESKVYVLLAALQAFRSTSSDVAATDIQYFTTFMILDKISYILLWFAAVFDIHS